MNKKYFTGIAFLLMLFLLISFNAKAQENQSTVSVSGIGTVFAQPDMVQMNITFSHTARTTQAAKNAAEETMRRILQILQEENIENNFIRTASLSYDIDYSRRVQTGQRVRQTIVVTVNDMINRPERFPNLLDKITEIDEVQVSNIQFDIENKAELFKQSRELAYQKAFEKATQYAEFSGNKIDRVLTISEVISRDIAQTRASSMSNIAIEKRPFDFSDSSSIPTGECGVTSEINVTFLLK